MSVEWICVLVVFRTISSLAGGYMFAQHIAKRLAVFVSSRIIPKSSLIVSFDTVLDNDLGKFSQVTIARERWSPALSVGAQLLLPYWVDPSRLAYLQFG